MPVDELTEDQAIEKLRALPDDRRRAVLAKLPTEKKRGILLKLGKPQPPQNVTAEVDKPEKTDHSGVVNTAVNFLRKAGKLAGESVDQSKAMLTKRIADLQGEAQHQQNEYIGPEAKGPAIARFGHGLLSLAPETAAVLDKVALGLLDWKTAVGLIGTKVQPELGAAYFMTMGAQQAAESGGADKDKRYAPDNVQNFLMGLSMVAGGPEGAKVGREGMTPPKAVQPPAEATPATLQQRAQSILDVGPDLTKRAVEKTDAAHAEAVADANAKQAAETDKTAGKNKAAIEKHADARREAYQEGERRKAEHATRTREVTERNREAQAKFDRRQKLETDLKQGSQQFGEGVAALDKEVKAHGDQMYDQVREKTDADKGESPEDVVNAVKYARKNIIKGSPESIKQFNDFLRRQPPEENADAIMDSARKSDSPEARAFADKWDSLAEGADETPGEYQPIRFSDYQGYSSELGTKLAKGGLDSDVYHAIKHVKEAIDEKRDTIAERNGAGDLLADANRHWREYMETFYDKPSAVAATLDSVGKLDPEHHATPFIKGRAANLGISSLRRYADRFPNAGHLANHVSAMRTLHEEMQGLPKKIKLEDLPDHPEPVEPPVPPKLEETKQVPIPEKEVDPRQLKKDEIAKKAREWGRLNAFDIRRLAGSIGVAAFLMRPEVLAYEPAFIAGKRAMKTVLSNEKIAKWLSEPQPEDLKLIERMPQEAQDDMRTNIKQFMQTQAEKGEPVTPSATFRGWLSQTGKTLVERGKELLKDDEGSLTLSRPRAGEENGATPTPTGDVPRGTNEHSNTAVGAAFDNEIWDQVKREHPDWNISQLAQEAAKRAKEGRGGPPTGRTTTGEGESEVDEATRRGPGSSGEGADIPALRRKVASLQTKYDAETEAGDAQRWKTREKLLDAEKELADAEGKE